MGKDQADHRSEKDIFSRYLAAYDFDNLSPRDEEDAVDIDLVDSDSDAAVDIDLVDSDNEKINLRKRVHSPLERANHPALLKRQLLKRKPVQYKEPSSSSSSIISVESASNSYEIGSFVEEDDDDDDEQGQSSYSGDSDDGEEEEEEEEEEDECDCE